MAQQGAMTPSKAAIETYWKNDEFLWNKLYRMGIPIKSMYGIFTYIWLMFMVNVGICIYIYIPYMVSYGICND